MAVRLCISRSRVVDADIFTHGCDAADRLVTSLLKCFMVTDMRKYSVPFDAPYYNDWVFTVPPEGYAQSDSVEEWEDEQAAGRGTVFARPSFPETVAAIGDATAQEAALLDKKGSSQSEKDRYWKQYVDRALRQKAASFKDQLQNAGANEISC